MNCFYFLRIYLFSGKVRRIGRANTVRPYRNVVFVPIRRGGETCGLPQNDPTVFFANALSHFPCKAKEAFLRSRKFVTKRNHSHCRDRRPRLSEKNDGGSKPPPYGKQLKVRNITKLSDLK